jgi:hypothetical protein
LTRTLRSTPKRLQSGRGCAWRRVAGAGDGERVDPSGHEHQRPAAIAASSWLRKAEVEARSVATSGLSAEELEQSVARTCLEEAA